MAVQAKKVERTIEDDAMDLALLLYDMYKAEKASDKIINGQNNANETQSK